MESSFYRWSNRAIIHEIPTLAEDDKIRALYELKLREGHGTFDSSLLAQDADTIKALGVIGVIHGEDNIILGES